MPVHQKLINQRRQRRQFRVRAPIKGTTERPRLTVYRSHKHIYCQLIDDSARLTLVSASTRDRGVRRDLKQTGNKGAAAQIGKIVAERALSAGISAVCFDRGPYKYHGRIQALADAARAAGLSF
jgi:large subunit ribosomal protein L18